LSILFFNEEPRPEGRGIKPAGGINMGRFA